MSDKSRKNFLIGPAGQREVRNLLRRADNPKQTIQDFQQTHSLHSMFAKAFQTIPKHAAKEGDDKLEPLDTDSVLTFLYHLGVSQHEVHKRISDALKLNLEDEIRKVEGTEPLLNLLKSCWQYATTIPELRPVLWAVLRKLGSDTPVAVLERLGERGTDKATLKHKEVWHPLPTLLKRLVWEADWVKYMKNKDPDNPKEYLELVQTTLFAQRLNPLIEQYVSQTVLRESANKTFVSSQIDRRLPTTQRRSLTSSKGGKNAFKNDSKQKIFEEAMLKCSQAIFEFRKLMSDGDSPAYRPKLLYATLSLLMGYHGTSPAFLGGDKHLYCTLVADILLSGRLPKAYLPVLSLARTLDDCVKAGIITDSQISDIQSALKKIYPSENNAITEPGASSKPAATNAGATTVHSAELKSLLKKTVAAGVDAMKEADPQSLFLNPVTDAIAPGYSKVIQKPMCMKQMLTTNYLTIQEWDRDVTLMFRNCIAYNTGNDGQWFRGEARRQHEVFKNDIYPQAKKIFEEESAKLLPARDVQKKRKASGALNIEPLEGTKLKKRKKGDKDTDNLPSMQALASMLLSDPFVIRILLDRLLKSLRIDTMKSSSLPVGHTVIPSLLQLLQLAQFSQQLCAIRGKRYMIPAVGIDPNDEDPVGFQLLRQYTPLLIKLFLEAELDKRTSDSKDLLSAAKSLPKRTNIISSETWQNTKHLHVLRGLVEGAMVHVCQPGNSFDKSLAQTFPKFADALSQLAPTPHLWEDRTFFLSLVQAIARHKGKLRSEARDTIVSTWLGWLKDAPNDGKGSMFSSAHESFLILINEWVTLGNLVLSREALITVTQDTVEAVDASEKSEDRKFKQAWKDDKFGDIKVLYERALKTLPETQLKEWESRIGIEEKDESGEESKVKTETDVDDNLTSPTT